MLSSTTATSSAAAARMTATLGTIRQFRHRPHRLFRGYTALAARNLPFTAMQFPLFEALRDRITQCRRQNGKQTASLAETTTITGVAAGVAGSIAAVLTTPVDVVKTRVMLAAAEEAEREAASKRMTEWTAAKDLWNEGGLRSLFRGALLRGVWTMLASGLYLGMYDMGRVHLARRRGLDLKQEDLM